MQMKNSREFTQMEGKKEEELNKTFQQRINKLIALWLNFK